MWNKVGCAGLVFSLILAFPLSARAEGWAMSDDGKYWMYFYSPSEYAEDEWIEDDGKVYYVDASGHMKTGWVKDKNSDDRYYMGEDGAKQFNTFTDDGKYVGSDGTEVVAFDTYRKAVKKELKNIFSALKKEGRDTAWVLTDDLNGDGYRDLAVALTDLERMDVPGSLLNVYIWNSEDQELSISFESDLNQSVDWARIMREKDSNFLWLEILTDSSGVLYFSMDDGSTMFENTDNFIMEMDEWGTPRYLQNGDEIERMEWLTLIKEKRDSLLDSISPAFVLTDLAGTDSLVDRSLSEEETYLWED